MHIGLIGGIGPAATDLYYRGLIEAMEKKGAPLTLTIAHADPRTLVRNFEARQPDAQAEIFAGLTRRLATAGAGAMAITSIGGHFCIEQFKPLSQLPIINMIDAMARFMAGSGVRTVGLLGTDTVMETRFYGGLPALNILAPPPDELSAVHRAYVDLAVSARVTAAHRQIFFDAGKAMQDNGAELILLAGTDLFLAFDGQSPGFEILDCAKVHVSAIAEVAAGEATIP